MSGLTYKDAGVNIQAGYEAVSLMGEHIRRTKTPGVLGDIGSFGGLFQLPAGYKEPVLVSGTDGVGTKLQLAFMSGVHHTVGIDLVAMCANDIVCQGAKPLFFLDYIGCGKLDPKQAEHIVKGIADGCVMAGCALIGGETAEMPGFYSEGEYDLAGFCVGVVEKGNIITPQKVKEGDVLMGLPSSGLHSNGFSLVRKLFFEQLQLPQDHQFEELHKPLIEELLTPTKLYVKPVLHLLDRGFDLHGIAHITGGGFVENIPRMLPGGLGAQIDFSAIAVPPIFRLIATKGKVAQGEMVKTFNMGIGMVLAVEEKDCHNIVDELKKQGESPVVMGRVVKSDTPIAFV